MSYVTTIFFLRSNSDQKLLQFSVILDPINLSICLSSLRLRNLSSEKEVNYYISLSSNLIYLISWVLFGYKKQRR